MLSIMLDGRPSQMRTSSQHKLHEGATKFPMDLGKESESKDGIHRGSTCRKAGLLGTPYWCQKWLKPREQNVGKHLPRHRQQCNGTVAGTLIPVTLPFIQSYIETMSTIYSQTSSLTSYISCFFSFLVFSLLSRFFCVVDWLR